MATEPAPSDNLSKEAARATEDVRVLLEFLGRRADSLLQAQFEDTRVDRGASLRRLAAPPCRTYKHFLNRFTVIETKFHDPKPAQDTPSPTLASPPEGDEELSDLAFLYLSRDFLAAVAAPATVDSIRVTNAYVARRRHSLFSGLWRRSNAKRTGRAADSQAECEAGARRLASRVVLIEWFALGGTVLTLMISAYAFAGHRILDSRSHIFSEYSAIGHDRVQLTTESGIKDLASPSSLASLCDRTAPPTDAEPKDVASPVRVAGPGIAAAAELISDPPRQTVATLRECSLYWRSKQNTENIAAVTLHMTSWSGVVINDLHVGEVFGINRAFIRKVADEHAEYCHALHLSRNPADGNCGPALEDLIYHTPEVVDTLLGCIALYLLPTLYGGLGAMAATLRALRRKVDLSLVTMTDRGRVQQDVILGVLCGAIIGLFFGSIGKASPQEGLGLSALALLAGYNISGVFSFLDELSNRVFQPARAGSADSGQG
jgi:hypothetical protein